MAFVRPKARILERTITAGNGPYALAGAVDGSYNTFASFMAIGDATEATIVEPGVAFWTGIVTYSAANQITLTTVEETKGTFGSGTKEIFPGGLASRALLREDMSGAILTGGNPIAYTVQSFRGYDTLTRLNGNAIAFTPHATNGGAVTLNVDGLGARPLRPAPSTELFSNVLIQGTPYVALYNHADQVFYLHGFFGNPYNVPLAAGLDYWGPTAPNSAFAFPFGQAISRTTYAALFALTGTNFGSGDGSTTFNLPDLRGRVAAKVDNMGGAAANRLPGFTINATGGAASVALGAANLPPHPHGASSGVENVPHFHNLNGGAPIPVPTGFANVPVGTGATVGVSYVNVGTGTSVEGSQHNHPIAVDNGPGSSAPISMLQPTIACHYIIRVL
jgi:microcystin-dependent protein